jgi:Flp pilus assembly protein TadG
MKKLTGESGQALITVVLCMSCLIGFAALAADVGVMLRERRLVQSAADSAAIAGALELNFNSGNVTSSARAAATQNGFTDGSGGATVAVHNPPSSGAHTSGTNSGSYVEAIVTQNQPTFLMKVFNLGSMNVSARAVAMNGGASYSCINVQDPTAKPAMLLQGSFQVDSPNCGIVINSNDPSDALEFKGNGGSITAGSIGVVGGIKGYHSGESTPAPISGIIPQSDPLNYLDSSFPSTTSCNSVPGGTLTGAVPSGCYSGNVTVKNAVLTGMYVFTGNVTLGGSVTTGAGGGTIDLASGSMTEAAGTTLNLVAPTTGTFNGIAIMAPPTNTSTVTLEFGNATGTIKGILYMAGANLFLHDSGGGSCPGALSLITDLIVGTLDDQTGSVCITSYSQTTPGSPLTTVKLVE